VQTVALLILTHEAAIAVNVGAKNRGELAFHRTLNKRDYLVKGSQNTIEGTKAGYWEIMDRPVS
jgi:hypothetical protein